MNTKQYAASSLLVALLITNTSPWIPISDGKVQSFQIQAV